MLLHDARRDARVTADGEIVLLEDQDRARWDRAAIDEALALVPLALRGGGGAYAIQAAIAALHDEAARAEDTDWPQIAALYDELYRRQPTAIVALNRAVAIAMWRGAEGRARARSSRCASFDGYHLLPAARAGSAAPARAHERGGEGVSRRRSRASAASRSGGFCSGGWRRAVARRRRSWAAKAPMGRQASRSPAWFSAQEYDRRSRNHFRMA